MKTSNVTWFCMTLDTTNAQARLRFKQLYGCEPAKVIRDHNMVWIGPVPADKAPTPPAAFIAGAGDKGSRK